MPAKSKKTLEWALNRIEEITALLENLDAPLETSMSLYKEGMELCVFCAQKLESAKSEIQILKNTGECITL